MSRLFYAVNRETGERWKPCKSYNKEYLFMYDSGYLGVCSYDGFYTHTSPLCNKTWKVVFNESMKSRIDRSLDKTNQ
jgi:hypothetical protein